MDVEALRSRCRAQGMRLTVQKVAVLEALARMSGHPSAEEVYATVRATLPQIARATVFRVLDELARHGVLRRVYHDGRPVRYEANPRPHHHLHCVVCGRLEDIELPALDPVLASQPLTDFVCEGASAVFWGRCGRCVAGRPGEPAAD